MCARSEAIFIKTILTTDAALSACKEHGINEVFATVWGDDHRESSTFCRFAGLAVFCGAHVQHGGKYRRKTFERTLFACTGMKWEALADITYFEYIPGYNEKDFKLSVYQGVYMAGYFAWTLRQQHAGYGYVGAFCSACGKNVQICKKNIRSLRHSLNFTPRWVTLSKKKQYMGIALADMYKNGDKDGLRHAAEEELPELYRRMCNLRKAHRDYFFWEYKPIGWEILDIRYGGAIMRIDTAIMRIKSYLSGDIKRLDELEELRLSFTGKEGEVIPGVLTYQMLCSASRL